MRGIEKNVAILPSWRTRIGWLRMFEYGRPKEITKEPTTTRKPLTYLSKNSAGSGVSESTEGFGRFRTGRRDNVILTTRTSGRNTMAVKISADFACLFDVRNMTLIAAAFGVTPTSIRTVYPYGAKLLRRRACIRRR